MAPFKASTVYDAVVGNTLFSLRNGLVPIIMEDCVGFIGRMGKVLVNLSKSAGESVLHAELEAAKLLRSKSYFTEKSFLNLTHPFILVL